MQEGTQLRKSERGIDREKEKKTEIKKEVGTEGRNERKENRTSMVGQCTKDNMRKSNAYVYSTDTTC